MSPVDHQETLVEAYLKGKVCGTGTMPTERYIIRLNDVLGVLGLQGLLFQLQYSLNTNNPDWIISTQLYSLVYIIFSGPNCHPFAFSSVKAFFDLFKVNQKGEKVSLLTLFVFKTIFFTIYPNFLTHCKPPSAFCFSSPGRWKRALSLRRYR